MLYESITDGLLIGRSIEKTVSILKETHTGPHIGGDSGNGRPLLVDCPDHIPLEFLQRVREGTPYESAAQALRNSGHFMGNRREG